jgi:3-oxoacyl-(acyl-carrier-protein) synthase
MKTSLLLSAAAIVLSGAFLTSCDSKKEEVRKQSIENKADALENEADLMKKKGEAAADATDRLAALESDLLDLQTRIGAPVQGLDLAAHYPRRKRRTMGLVALFATHATEQAIAHAGLTPELLGNGRCGIAYGSTTGSSTTTGSSNCSERSEIDDPPRTPVPSVCRSIAIGSTSPSL